MGGQVFKNQEDLQPMEQTVSTSKLNELQASMLAMIACAATPEPLQQTVNTNGRRGGGV